MIDIKGGDPKERITKAMQAAKRNGNLKMANMQLAEFPEAIHKFNEVSIQGDNWWEDIPLTIIDLSHNKIP